MCRVPMAIVFAVLMSAAVGEQVLVGEARDPRTGELVYREWHHIQLPEHRVEYFDRDGQLIATNALDYSRSPISPSHRQEDLRHQQVLGARWDDEQLVLFKNADQSAVSYDNPLVISSGFDGFVRMHWDALRAGERKVFDFAVPTRLTTLSMRIEAMPLEALDSGKTLKPNWQVFRVEPANLLVRWLGEPILLVYDSQQRLRLYQGLSNLLSAQGDGQQVRIEYDYPESRNGGDAGKAGGPLVTLTNPSAG